MKNTIYVIAVLFVFLFSRCSDTVTVQSGVEDGTEMAPGSSISMSLEQNYPNPYNGSTQIEFATYKPMHIKLSVYTEDWEKAATILDRDFSVGFYHTWFDAINSKGEELPAGDYYYTLEGDGKMLIRKMKIIK